MQGPLTAGYISNLVESKNPEMQVNKEQSKEPQMGNN